MRQRGLIVHTQVGCGGFKVDLAIVHSHIPGRYVLGIECDGATYHSSATARDRDRLRQEVLENLGWRILRLWSTDWVRNRESQVKRVLSGLESPECPGPTRHAPRFVSSSTAACTLETVARRAASVAKVDYTFDSIEDVPGEILKRILLQNLRVFGATSSDDLVQAVSSNLGFKRTGKRIQSRIEEVIEDLVGLGNVCRREDDRLQLAN